MNTSNNIIIFTYNFNYNFLLQNMCQKNNLELLFIIILHF